MVVKKEIMNCWYKKNVWQVGEQEGSKFMMGEVSLDGEEIETFPIHLDQNGVG